jgi:hypothetical protein
MPFRPHRRLLPPAEDKAERALPAEYKKRRGRVGDAWWHITRHNSQNLHTLGIAVRLTYRLMCVYMITLIHRRRTRSIFATTSISVPGLADQDSMNVRHDLPFWARKHRLNLKD